MFKWSFKSVLEWMHNSVSRSHFYFKANVLSIRIVLPGPKIITSSNCDRNRPSLCWHKDTVATNVFFAMFSLAEPYPIQSGDQMSRLHGVSRLHIKVKAALRSLMKLICVCICGTHPWEDMRENSVRFNWTRKQQKSKSAAGSHAWPHIHTLAADWQTAPSLLSVPD